MDPYKLASERVQFFAVISYLFISQRAILIKNLGRIEMFYTEHFNTRSQDQDECWKDANLFYWSHIKDWLVNGNLLSTKLLPSCLSGYKVQGIDTTENGIHARCLCTSMQVYGGCK